MAGRFRWRGYQRYGNELRRRRVSINILGGGFEDSVLTAIRAASSIASPFLRALPFPSSLPLTAGGECGAINRLGEGPTEAGRVPNAIVGRTLARCTPLKVVGHPHGLEQVVESLTRIYGRRNERMAKYMEKGTNETCCSFLTYAAREAAGRSRLC